jgi:glycosyltransferase involved in cell wall biosynthesis
MWQRGFTGELVAYEKLTPSCVGANDLVVAVGADCTLGIADLPDWCGVKVQNCHGRELSNMENMRKAWGLRMPRVVVASYLQREMRQQGTTDEIYTVHNGVNRLEYFPSVAPGNRNGIGAVFHGAYTKGPEMVLEVYRRIHEQRPEVLLTMFGSYPRPTDLPRTAHYVRLPPVSKARDLYSSAQVWLCTSRSEGFPGPVLEAMACGCAVVATDCGGTADQIEDGVNGFLVPVDDADKMTGRILRLLDDPELRQRMVTASEANLAQFTWPHAIECLEIALKAIVANARMSVSDVIK